MRPISNGLVCILTVSLLSGLLGTRTAQAQSGDDCQSPQTQMMMNICANREYAQADAALNDAWGPARKFADAIGKGTLLLEAQRAWLAYRNAACLAQASPYEGGSIQPMIYSNCLSRLTAQRTEMLKDFHAF